MTTSAIYASEAAQVQTAIEREFADEYHVKLRFEEVPCGWLGP